MCTFGKGVKYQKILKVLFKEVIKMKRKLLVMILSVVITGSTLAGCGSDNAKVESGSEIS